MRRFTLIPLLAALLLSAWNARAGAKYDSMIAEVIARRAALDQSAVADPKAEALRVKGIALLDEALQIHSASGLSEASDFLKTLGKALVTIDKAARRVRPSAFAVAADAATASIWTVASNVFLLPVGKATDPIQTLAKRLRPAFRSAGKGQFAKAVGKLAKAWPALLRVDPNP